jgi:WD40 repeat protein
MNEETLFAAAVELADPAARQVFLDRACGGDVGLRRRLDRLLAADEHPADILSRGAAVVLEPAGLAPPAAGEVLAGRFKLRRKLGEGGMGEVWVADQLDPVRRRVALKVVRPGRDSDRLLARFEAERQALALMDHPNIAKVFDAGMSGEEAGPAAGGRPYFVMELIEGVPITDYCEANRLTLRERLELFIPVCHAVQHAHQKGIIHRDLKPSNILVARYDGRPVPKVIDFGVAKATGPRLTEDTVRTEVGLLVGTLEYMPPEQAELSHLDVDTRSDVYALGVVLYELLTGSVPFPRTELHGLPLVEILRRIRQVDPPRPSVRLSGQATPPAVAAARRAGPRKLAALLRGELDWIVMKALEKDRARRYESASALALDLQRYLADEPVAAGPPSAGYRLRKFVRRNRGPVLAAGLLLLALVAGVVGTGWGLVEAVRARKDEADQRRETDRLLRESERMLYASRINLAQQAWENNNTSLAIHHLDSCRPDFRDWEYDFLFTLFHSNHRTYRNPGLDDGSVVVNSVAVSRDGRRIVAGGGNGMVNLWNADTGERTRSLRGHTAGVACVAISPDGKRVASGGHDNTVNVWDADTGERVLSLSGAERIVSSVAFSPDGKRIAVSADSTLKVWDAGTGELALTVAIPPPLSVTNVAWSPDGKRIVCGHVWDAQTGKSVLGLSGDPLGDTLRVNFVAFSPDGKRIAAGCNDRTIHVWVASEGRRIQTLRGHTEPVTCVAWSPDSQFLISGSEDKTVRIWDASTSQELRILKGHTRQVTCIAAMPDGRRIVSGSQDNTIKVWDAVWGEGERQETRTLRRMLGSVIAMALSPDGKRVASGRSNSPYVEICDVATPWRCKLLEGHRGSIHGIAFSPDGKRIATGNGDRTVKVWDAGTFQELMTLAGHTQGVTSVAWSPDGSRILSGSADQTVKVWDAVTGAEVRTLAGHTGWVCDVAWSPDGGRILTGSADQTVKVWDAVTGAEIRTLTGHTLDVWCVAWTPDGSRILSGSRDKTAKIWDAASGEEIGTLQGHGDSVRRVAVIPNHRRIVTASGDGTLKLWDADTGYETLTLKAHTTAVNVIALSPDGKLILSGGEDRAVKAWHAGPSGQ